MAGSGNSPVGGSSKGILERTSIPFPPHQPLPALCPKGKRALPSPLKACPKGGAWGGACGHRNFEPAPPRGGGEKASLKNHSAKILSVLFSVFRFPYRRSSRGRSVPRKAAPPHALPDKGRKGIGCLRLAFLSWQAILG